MGVLADKFGVPPFSVLDSKQGYWINRKQEWKDLGIKSEVGRDVKFLPSAETRPSWKNYNKDLADPTKNATVSIFDPVLTELCYKWFCPKGGRILDPFAGGSVRGIVASQLGFRYTGFDLRKEQIDANYDNLTTLKFPVGKPNWIVSDSEQVKVYASGKFDLIFSCPPYHDLEKYGKDPNDLSNMDYDTFKAKYFRIIKNCCDLLNDNRFAVFVVSEIRDKNGKYKNLVRHTIQAFEECGLEYYNEIVYLNQIGTLPIRTSDSFISGRKVGRNHQNVICMYKGDPKQIWKLETDGEFTPLVEQENKPSEQIVGFSRQLVGEFPEIISLGLPENESIEEFEKDMDMLTKQTMKVLDDEEDLKQTKAGILETRFGVPPFSILDTKQAYWMNRKKEWLEIGLDSEVGRDAKTLNTQEWVLEKGLTGASGNQSGVSIFDPVLCELIYKWFCVPNGKILDPFAGGSVRGVVASVFGYDYTGVDLREEQIKANYENAIKLSITLPITPKWICDDSINIKNVGGQYDMIMSCPPYHDLEEYSKDSRDLSNMDYTSFLTKYKEIIKNSVSMLKNNSFAVFVVGEIRDGDGYYKNFVGETIKAFREAGMEYYNDMILYNQFGSLPIRVGKQFEPYRKIGKIHQNVLVFYKGDPKLIKPMNMSINAFTPIKDMKLNIQPIATEVPIITEVPIVTEVPNTKCDVCGYVAKDKESFDAHIPRPFHQGFL